MRSLTLPLIGASLLFVGITANAGEPMTLSDAQLDGITGAGISAGLGRSVSNTVNRNTGYGGGGDHSYRYNPDALPNEHHLDRHGQYGPGGKKCPCMGLGNNVNSRGGFTPGQERGYNGLGFKN